MILFIPSFAPLKLSCKFSPVVNLSLMRGSIHPTQPFPWLLSSIHSHLTHFLFSFFSYPSSKNSWNTWIQWHWFDWLACQNWTIFWVEWDSARIQGYDGPSLYGGECPLMVALVTPPPSEFNLRTIFSRIGQPLQHWYTDESLREVGCCETNGFCLSLYQWVRDSDCSSS